jgi:serine/threonine-protein kinase
MNVGHPAGTVPARIGRYEILERIGKGAMGVVYAARDEMMDRVVAVKVMMADLEGEPDTRARFYREAQAAGRLLHPNIITIYDIGEEEGRIYLVMELLKGQTLADFLRQPSVTLEQKVDLMVQTCEGLGAAHAGSIVHRDVKPGNLFVLSDGSLKILDFGVARLASSTMTASGFIIGTPDYMSPEQARGAEIDPRSDIFSAGAVFYYVLSGRKPFAARDLPAVLRKVQSEPPTPLDEDEAPGPLARIVARSLAKDPARRYQTMAELALDLARFKRHYEAETRQVAVSARERYDSIQALTREGREMAEALGLPALGEPPAAASLRALHPAFVERAPELLLVPFTRTEVLGIAGGLASEQEALERDVARLRRAHDACASARRALDERQPAAAEHSLNEAIPELPDTAVVRDLRARVTEAARVERARLARLEVLEADARRAAASEQWENVLALCEDGVGCGGGPEFDRLRLRASEAIDRRERLRAKAVERTLERVHRALGEKRFDAADAALEEVRGLGADPAELERLATRVTEARRRSAEEAARAVRAAEAISLARAEFHAGHRAASLVVLRDCLAECADAPGVQTELARLQDEAQRLEEAERRRAQAAEHAAAAAAAVERGDFQAAADEAAAALAVEPGHPEASRIHSSAVSTLRAQADARQRHARAEEMIERGRADLEAGALGKAAREARQALEHEADSHAAARLLEDVTRRQAAQDAEREQARLVQHELKAARHALRGGNLEAARQAVDRAGRLSPGDAAVLDAERSVTQALERREQAQRELDEETVDLSPVNDDTVGMTSVPAGPGAMLQRLIARLRAFRRR